MALVLEPIPQLSAMLLSLRMIKAHEGPLAATIGDIDQRSKNTKSSDRAGWLAIYRDTLVLLPRMIETHGSRPSGGAANSGAAGGGLRPTPLPNHRLSGAASSAQNALQRALNDWTPRLATQERELLKRTTETAIEKLPVVSKVDESLGELLYTYDPNELDAFWRWLGSAERTWAENNKALVAVRAQEALADTLADLPSEMAQFQVANASIEISSVAAIPRLRGHRIANPGFFQSLGTTYRFVMSAVTAASGFGFFATRIIGGTIAQILPIVLGFVFICTVVVAIVTLPKQRRQSMARLKARAAEVLERETVDAIRVRLKTISDAQLSAIRKHIAAETARLKASWRDIAPSDPGGNSGAFNATPPPLSLSMGLMPSDVAKARGEWKDAMEARVAQIEAELGAGSGATSPTTTGSPVS